MNKYNSVFLDVCLCVLTCLSDNVYILFCIDICVSLSVCVCVYVLVESEVMRLMWCSLMCLAARDQREKKERLVFISQSVFLSVSVCLL